MPTLTPEQFARLPKYARDELTRLRYELGVARHNIKALRENSFPSAGNDMSIRIRYALGNDQPIDLHSRAIVEFDVEGGVATASIRRGRLHISTGDGGLIIRPASSNVAEISVDEF